MTIIGFVNRCKKKIDSCVSSTAPSVIIEGEPIKDARIASVKNRGIKLRYVTEITADNLAYCKEMLKFSEIRHLDGIKGNFEVADEKEYVAVATLYEAQPIPQLIFSNVPEIVEQQQFIFDSFWDKGVPAEQRITEIEKGIVPSITTILTDYKKAEIKEFDMIEKAEKEIQIIYSTPGAFHLQEKSGILELLKEKADQQKNLQISILVPIDLLVKKSLSLRPLTNAKNNNIHIQDIAPSIDIKIKSLVTDRSESLVMEIKELIDQELITIIGFSVYSNSLPTVLTYCSIFELMHNQSILSEELKHEGELKDEFINTAAHELRTPTQAITGYTEMNDELFDDLLRNRDKATDQEQANIIAKLHEYHESISRNASRLNILINNLLDVARFESNSNNGNIVLYKEKVDLVKEINEIIEIQFSNKLKEKGNKISFVNNSLGEQCGIYSDKLRLNQILINLIDNAIKFSKRDDSINIMIKDNNDFGFNLSETEVDTTNRVSNNDKSDHLIQEGDDEKSTEKQEMVYVGISDTGKGISSKIMPKLFEKFVTDSDFGTGLGLFITRKLVEAHGGKIWAFNNNDGVGSTFVFSLPGK
ncbi:sensor histidine kinase [Candidatus Nitrosocosmicus arcticus]|uniref:histidine kinase n=1 Tax=Candidatus Nitrosocosmicus arcticus TaxID=2035267 RepID=A0A557SZ04_9ARCH|nr:HAMP domain-containing sensor histidine kinase [Candidatus Nitrosocosmicus arcticus]TVP41828.1 putative histidine kinase [Candidatus Nitrosocosmicus arcticus]